VILHEYHARSLEAMLSRADDAMNRMEWLMFNAGQDGAVRKIESTLSVDRRETLLAQLRTLRSLLAAVAETFSLQPHALDIRHVLDAELATLWVLLEDCRPARMKGYGQQFAPEARAALEESVDQLLAHVATMRGQVD
jgi:hypothetical protein